VVGCYDGARGVTGDSVQGSEGKIGRSGRTAYAVALAVIVLDQASKAWILYGLKLPSIGSYPVVPPWFRLDMVFNRGMSFGLLHAAGGAGRWSLTLFALLVAGGLGWWAKNSDRPLFVWAAGLLIGGSLGNVIDRFRLGMVVDFLDFSGLHFPFVFNLADAAVSVGAVLLLLEAFGPSLLDAWTRCRAKLRSMLDSRRVRGN
jgi:signal peptidase II